MSPLGYETDYLDAFASIVKRLRERFGRDDPRERNKLSLTSECGGGLRQVKQRRDKITPLRRVASGFCSSRPARWDGANMCEVTWVLDRMDPGPRGKESLSWRSAFSGATRKRSHVSPKKGREGGGRLRPSRQGDQPDFPALEAIGRSVERGGDLLVNISRDRATDKDDEAV